MVNPSTVQQISPDLFLIPLPVPIRGFEGFITSWIYTGGPVIVVDVGPSAGAEYLLAALAEIGISQPDAILLTHIHLDHAGGIGNILKSLPRTPVVCHPKAVDHLIDPQRLWEGSLKTLGEVARNYGPMIPVAPTSIIPADQLDITGINAVATPGHAVHQYSFLIKDLLFAGEAGGVCIGTGQGEFYMRPATPPRFFMEICLESIDRLIALSPERICYGHVGMQDHAVELLAAHKEQLLRWHRLIKPWVDENPEIDKAREDACIELLLASDPLLSGFSALTDSARERERFFLRNSLRGYWGYLL